MDEGRRANGAVITIAQARRLANRADMTTPRGSGTPKRITPEALRGLTCTGCACKIRFTMDHKKDSGNVFVSAYFGLTSASRHTSTCRFRARSSVEQVVAVSREATGDEVIVPVDGRYRLRLHVITEQLDRIEQSNADAESRIANRAARRHSYQQSARVLEPYLRTATGIARLYDRLENPEDLAAVRDMIVIQHEGKDVPWDEFCYDETRWGKLLARLATDEALWHPIAVIGSFGPIEPRANNRLTRFRRSTDVKFFGKREVGVQIYARESRFLKRGRRRARVLVVGRPWAGKLGGSESIRLRIESPSQLATV
jgi:hypothetical protein